MDDDIIEALADAICSEMEQTHTTTGLHTLCDAAVAIAKVINDYEPTYDLRYFYRRAGCPEPYPEHPMKG